MIELIPTGLDDRVLGLRIYAEIQVLGRITPSALMEDLPLSMHHFRDVEREAVVADAGWLALLARVRDLIPDIEVRHFSWLEREGALKWINA
jgi:hypothetical protein